MAEFREWLWILGGGLLPAYLVGAVPYGFLFGRLKGLDIRQHGSGNIGATNVWRTLGRGWGGLTFALDFAKAPLAAWLADVALPRSEDAIAAVAGRVGFHEIAIFLGAVLGHNYPIWLKFRGGKGIATSAGGLLWLMPGSFLTMAAVWVMAFAASRYVSLASVVAAAALPFATRFFYPSEPLLLEFTCLLSVMAIWRHRANIRRLMDGTEHRWSNRPRAAASSQTGSSVSKLDTPHSTHDP